MDATLQEKACSVASLIMSVTHKGTITCTRKVGGGSLDPESIFEMTEVSPNPQLPPQPNNSSIHLQVDLNCSLSECFPSEEHFCRLQAGKRVGRALHAPLMKLLQQEESLGKKKQKVGFLS